MKKKEFLSYSIAVVNINFVLRFKILIERSSWHYILASKILPMIKEKHILFSFELTEKVLENNKNSGKTQGKLKYKTAVNPAVWFMIYKDSNVIK